MSVSQLEYFIAVAEEQHLSRAALRLHLSQPPLSRHIKCLEEEVGVPLFERTPRGMRLLPDGLRFLEEARDVVRRFHSLGEFKAGAGPARRIERPRAPR